MIGPDRLALGKTGEALACRELRRRGYEILARRYRTRVGELDIVARDGSTVVFVEVKARRSIRFGGGADAVGWRKRHKLRLMAVDYLVRHTSGDVPCRFDIVVVTARLDGRWVVEVIENAFDATGAGL